MSCFDKTINLTINLTINPTINLGHAAIISIVSSGASHLPTCAQASNFLGFTDADDADLRSHRRWTRFRRDSSKLLEINAAAHAIAEYRCEYRHEYGVFAMPVIANLLITHHSQPVHDLRNAEYAEIVNRLSVRLVEPDAAAHPRDGAGVR